MKNKKKVAILLTTTYSFLFTYLFIYFVFFQKLCTTFSDSHGETILKKISPTSFSMLFVFENNLGVN